MDTYFCYCCLSDKKLISLFNTTEVNGKAESYADMLASSFAIKIAKSEFEDIDTNICEVCAVGLKSAMDLRNSVLQTINILEINNVVTTKSCDSFLFVTKVHEENFQEENSSENFIKQNDRINHKTDIEEEYSEEYEEVEYLDLSADEIILDEPNMTNLDEEAQISLNNGYNVQSTVKRRKRIRPSGNEKKDALDAKKVKIRTVEKIPYEITDDLKCPMCANERFATEKMYHIHMNTHYPNHLCPTCGRSFATKLRLIRHVPTHNRGVFPCLKCDKVCKTKDSLRSHCKREHYKIKINKCTICSDRFNSYHERMVHLAKVHGAEKTHSCKYCSKTFLESANLYSHVTHVHMKKKYECPFCKAGYSRRERLEAHLTSHTGQRNYMCSLCSTTFKTEIAVRVHIKKKHTGVME